MLQLTFFIFDFPAETRCNNQKSQDYNMQLDLTLEQIKLLFMMENTMRIIDYSMNHVAKPFSNKAVGEEGELASDIDETMRDEEGQTIHGDEDSNFSSYAYGSENELGDSFWADFDLE